MISDILPIFDELESSTDNNMTTNDHTGDILQESPPPDTTRIYFQNLNGIQWDKEGGKWPYVCEVIAGINVDIACFAEINTDTNNYNVRRKMEMIATRQFQQCQLILSTSKYTTSSPYKPGGTAIMANQATTALVRSYSRDRMGRWASIRLQTAESRYLRIISAYQACENIRPGSNSVAAQQRAQLLEEDSTQSEMRRRTPREAFVDDLQSFIHQSQINGDDIILVGDFNEDITNEGSGIARLAATCGLADLFNIRLGSPILPATYQRGTRRIDYALITPTLITAVQAAGYDPFGYRIPSDHRGLYIDLKSNALFQDGPCPLAPKEQREFNSKAPGTVEKYVNAKIRYLSDHNFSDRLERLQALKRPDNALAEALDRDFQRASHHAARICSKRQSPPWSPHLGEAWVALHFYKMA